MQNCYKMFIVRDAPVSNTKFYGQVYNNYLKCCFIIIISIMLIFLREELFKRNWNNGGVLTLLSVGEMSTPV